MYIYHNTNKDNLVDILYNGYLRTGKYINKSNQNIHKKMQKYIYFNITKKRGFKYILPYTLIFPSNVLYDYKFYINTHSQIGVINNDTVKYKKYTKFIDLILMMLFEFIIDTLKKKVINNIHSYYFSQFKHELFIDKPISITKAKYIVLSSDLSPLDKKIINKINESYPYIKIIYNNEFELYKSIDSAIF